MQDKIAQILFCVAAGCALSLIVAAALSRADRNRPSFGVAPRLLLAAGPVYLGADYMLYQDRWVAVCAAAAFVLGLYSLRGWWAPRSRPRAASGPGENAVPAEEGPMPARSGVLYLAGPQRGASAARGALRSRVLAVVRADRHAARPDDRSMPNAA